MKNIPKETDTKAINLCTPHPSLPLKEEG